MNDLFNALIEPFQAQYHGFNEAAGGHQIEVPHHQAASLLQELAKNPQLWFDYLVSITATHSTVDHSEFWIHYHLVSITKNLTCHVYTQLKGIESELPSITSVSNIWKTADWHERECAEMFGIQFENHPNLINLLLPADWQGYPLRKTYKAADTYHGLKIAYIEN